MKRIGLLSDTHGWLDERLFKHFEQCDEIWHAGDIGTPALADRLAAFKPLHAVHGNIDGTELRLMFPKILAFECEQVRILMTHIGGYPGRYDREAYTHIMAYQPKIFVCGHSHILKIQYDRRLKMLCLNPGAFGRQGFQQVRTLLRFEIDHSDIRNIEVIEIKRNTAY